MTQKIWGGRFRKEIDSIANRFNSSIRFDSRLYAHDIDGSMAHCRMLAKQGIITDEEASTILETLATILRELNRGEIPLSDHYEDIHSFVEKTLIERVGAVGEKLHTGRSRNDQVALDVRMYIREVIHETVGLLKDTQQSLIRLAEDNMDLVMPGYTHLQRAQPVLVSHHLLAYYEMLKRDRQRFMETLARTNILPLGSAALAGPTFGLDRDMVAKELEFDAITENSIDAVSDRDFVLDFLFASSMLMMHLSRMSEELVIWSSQEFGFITISDDFCTGSSIMPQKKNPDMPELIRGKTGRVYGHLMSLLTTMKGLPLAYNKDMQEDKEALFDTVDTIVICLQVMSRLLSAITFNSERLESAIGKGFLAATDLADYLVRKGVTFREAHEIVGKMVLFAADKEKELHELSLAEMRRFSKKIDKDVNGWLVPALTVNRRNIPGGTGPESVKARLKQAREELPS